MATDDKKSTDFTGQASAGKSQTSRRIKTLGGVLFVVGILLSLAVNLIDFRPIVEAQEVREERRATEAAEAAVREEQNALAVARYNEELQRFDQGTWVLVGHTTGNEWEVFMDSFLVDANGKVEEFVFTYSFVIDDKAYLNTWSCEASQIQRYDCTLRQQFDGGSARNDARLEREDESSFSGRYLFQREWRTVSLVRKE